MTKEEFINDLYDECNTYQNEFQQGFKDCLNYAVGQLDNIDYFDKSSWKVYPKIKPSEEGEYLCTVKSLFKDGKNYVEILYYRNKKGNLFEDEWSGKGFYKYDSEYGDFKISDVIAWVELPEPYEKVKKEKK